VLVTLAPAQITALERKFADNNEKFEKEFLPATRASAGARRRSACSALRDFAGELTVDQEARIELFALAHERQSRCASKTGATCSTISSPRSRRHQTQELGRDARRDLRQAGARRTRRSSRDRAGTTRWRSSSSSSTVAVSKQRAHVSGAFRTTPTISRLAGEKKEAA